jgi:hypothetical protein
MILDAVAAFKLLAEFNLNGIRSVLKAHYHFYRSLPELQRKRRQLHQDGHFSKPAKKFPRSIVFQFYVRKRKRFGEIK